MTRGGFRPNAGRKPLPKEIKRLPRKFYLNESEYLKVREFVTCIKKNLLK